MKFRTSSIVLIVLTLVAAGCSKKADTTAPKTIDVGVVELTAGMPTDVDLKDGNTCRITPKKLSDGSLMLDMQIEKDGTVVASPRAPAQPDQPVTISIGDENLTLTPHMK